MLSHRSLVVVVGCVAVLGSSNGLAQVSSLPVLEPVFEPPVASPCNEFACHSWAEFDGDTLATQGPARFSGIYIFTRARSGAWSLQSVLMDPESSATEMPTFDPGFGQMVALKGNELLATVGYVDPGTGIFQSKVFVFERSGTEWAHRQTLVFQDQIVALALDDGTAVITTSATIGPRRTVHVFGKRGRYYHLETEISPEQMPYSDFGRPLAIDGGTILVGASGDYSGETGSVYVFDRRGGAWILAQQLGPATGAGNSSFGASIDIDGDRIAVGSSQAVTANSNHGTVQVYVRRGGRWHVSQVIENPIATSIPNEGFGTAVSLEGRRLLVGGFIGDRFVNGGPLAYLFELDRDTWKPTAVLAARNPRIVRISGDQALVDAERPRYGTDPFIFDLPAPQFQSPCLRDRSATRAMTDPVLPDHTPD